MGTRNPVASLGLVSPRAVTHGVTPLYFNRVNLRSASTNTLLLPRTRTKTIGPRGFFYSCPAAWNSLPSALRILDQSLSVFKKNLKKFLFSKINFLVTVILYLALFVYIFVINILTVAVGASVMNIY